MFLLQSCIIFLVFYGKDVLASHSTKDCVKKPSGVYNIEKIIVVKSDNFRQTTNIFDGNKKYADFNDELTYDDFENRISEDDNEGHHNSKRSTKENSLISNDLIDESASENNEDNNEEYDIGQRIVGGHSVDITEYPFIALYGLSCGSSILNRYWLITAAHCRTSEKYVYVGSSVLNKGKRYEIEKHVVHPLYEKTGTHFDYDYQLLKLKKPLTYSDKVKPIELGNSSDIELGKMTSIIGWGTLRENEKKMSKYLMAAHVPIIDSKTCQKMRGGLYGILLTPRMFCAGYLEGGVDSCQGDSGGPIIRNNRLIGLISFGAGCANFDSPGVYARIPSASDWIKQIISE